MRWTAVLTLAVLVAVAVNVQAGVTVSSISHSPENPVPGENITITADITTDGGTQIKSVFVFFCWDKPVDSCGMPVEMKMVNGKYTAEISGDWGADAKIKLNITVQDTEGNKYASDFYYIHVSSSSSDDPSSYDTQAGCEEAGYYWYSNACHGEPNSPDLYEDEAGCTGAGYYWYDGACHATEKRPENYSTQKSCEDAGYYWYDNKCNAEKKKEDNRQSPGFGGALFVLSLALIGSLLLLRRS